MARRCQLGPSLLTRLTPYSRQTVAHKNAVQKNPARWDGKADVNQAPFSRIFYAFPDVALEMENSVGFF